MKDRWNRIAGEFAHHLPYTIVGSLIAMAGVWWFATQHLAGGRDEALFTLGRSSFHLFHPLHVLLSAIATTSLFWRHERHVVRAHERLREQEVIAGEVLYPRRLGP